ncbi:MAG: hypothetical protein KAU28_00865 [Phycisphaerae bacterium]|nr:hypothetical protein [Phycisphaerae bacterium]
MAVFLAAGVMTLCISRLAWPQGRLSKPGTLSKLGLSSAYSSASHGVGSLRSSAGADGGVLQSRIGSAASFSITHSSGKGGASSRVPTAGSLRKGVRVPTHTNILTYTGSKGISRALLGNESSATFAAKMYLFTEGSGELSSLSDRNEPITSLVPQEPGPYQQYLKKGEERFREGSFLDAFRQFQLANAINSRNPESLLSMTHARFALGEYSSAAFNLRQTLKYLPELPLLPLQPKAFYGDPGTYLEHYGDLLQHINKNPKDPGAYMVLAYYHWFGEEVDEARTALLNAKQSIEDPDKAPEIKEAIEIFWDGMLVSGKVSGKLQESDSPAPEKQPSQAEKPTPAEAGKKEPPKEAE